RDVVLDKVIRFAGIDEPEILAIQLELAGCVYRVTRDADLRREGDRLRDAVQVEIPGHGVGRAVRPAWGNPRGGENYLGELRDVEEIRGLEVRDEFLLVGRDRRRIDLDGDLALLDLPTRGQIDRPGELLKRAVVLAGDLRPRPLDAGIGV